MNGVPDSSNNEDSANRDVKSVSNAKNCFLSLESVRSYSDSIGIHPLHTSVAKELSEEITFRLRILLQDASKFMIHSRRNKLMSTDVNSALKMEGESGLLGVSMGHSDGVALRCASSGGGRLVHFNDEKVVDLRDLSSSTLPKIPISSTLKAHWLAIDGVQPSIPENPSSKSIEEMKGECADPIKRLDNNDAKENKITDVLEFKATNNNASAAVKNMETVNVKQLATHELSVEQQMYYKEITEACVGSDESKRGEALQSLACDPGLHQMLPRLATFVGEGVRVNVVQRNLAILIYLMRMVKSLLENKTLFLDKYLHELIPAVSTCIGARQLCTRPDIDNHFALRDFASRLLASICKNFDTPTNNLQTRITRMFSNSLSQAILSFIHEDVNARDPVPLVNFYGPLTALQEMGSEVTRVFILPHIRGLSRRIELVDEWHNEGMNRGGLNFAAERHVVTYIRKLFHKHINPVIRTERTNTKLPESKHSYIQDYGQTMGTFIFNEIGQIGASEASIVLPNATPAQVVAPPNPQQQIASPAPISQNAMQRVYFVQTPSAN